MTFFGGTDIGLVRESNQDRFSCVKISDNTAFAVLCDGMGGHTGGNIASETTIRFITDMLRRDLTDNLSETSLRGILHSAAEGANALVYQAAKKDPDLASMGTTLVVAICSGNALYISYVGDSRLYAVSAQRESQLTKDHTVVQMLVDIGEISQEAAQSHPKRHYITRAVGVANAVDADFLVHTLAPDDILLLCSDGLYNYLEPDTLYPLLCECVAKQSVSPLIELAKERGGADNITAVIGAAKQPAGGNNLNG